MACTKDELAAAINSYAAARMTGDQSLIEFSSSKVGELLNTIEFGEPAEAKEEE